MAVILLIAALIVITVVVYDSLQKGPTDEQVTQAYDKGVRDAQYEIELHEMPIDDFISLLGDDYMESRNDLVDDLTKELTEFFLFQFTEWIAGWDSENSYTIYQRGSETSGDTLDGG